MKVVAKCVALVADAKTGSRVSNDSALRGLSLNNVEVVILAACTNIIQRYFHNILIK